MRTCTILFLLSLVSCVGELPNKEVIQQEYYDSKVKAFMDQKKTTCINNARVDAQNRVDSLLNIMINASLFDTLNFPNRPVKPNTPEHIIDKVSKFEIEDDK